MAHRDDREAAHHRADALERELRDAKQELAQLKGAAPAPVAARPSNSKHAFIAAFVLLGVAGTIGGFVRQHQRRQEGRRLLAAFDQGYRVRQAAREEAERMRRMAEEMEARQRARVATEEQATRLTQQMQQAPTQEITWRGTLDSTSLPGLRTGDACTLTGDFSGFDRVARLHALTVRCGLVEVHRSLYAPPRTASGLREGPVAGSAARVYMLSFEDRRSRGIVSVSTKRHEVTLAGGDGEGAITTLFIRDVSEAREGDSIGRPAAQREPAFEGFREESARVSRVSGSAPVRAGDRCAFQLRPVWEYPESCRVAVRCGTTWLYGAGESGYLTCAVREGRAVSALDETPTAHGGDPRLRWEGRRVVVSDFTEAGAWEVTLGL